MTHRHLKTVAVANELLFRGAIVVPENLFVEVAEKMKWFDVNVGALQTALEQTPEVFQTVRVHLAVYIPFGMVNRFVCVIAVQSLVRQESISVDRALRFHVCANSGLQFMCPAIWNDTGLNLTTAFQYSHNRRFALHATVNNFKLALVSVHETRRTADEGFIYFYFLAAPTNLHEVLVMQLLPTTRVRQEPLHRREHGVRHFGLGPVEGGREGQKVGARNQAREGVAHGEGNDRIVAAPDQEGRLPDVAKPLPEPREVELLQHARRCVRVSAVPGQVVRRA